MQLDEFVSGLKGDLGSDLVCVCEYGKVDKRLLVVVDSFEFNVFERVVETVRKFVKGDQLMPLFLTRETLRDGVDVFPLEFLEMKFTASVLYGENVFESMVFRREYVRRELEFEFRSKLISLRQGFLEVSGRKGKLHELVSSAVPTLLPICYGLLYVRGVVVPASVDEIFAEITRVYEINVDVLRAIERGEAEKEGVSGLKVYVKKLMILLAELGELLDEMIIEDE